MTADALSTEAFIGRFLQLLDEAATTSTYKYALLLALIDICRENVGGGGGPVGWTTSRHVAARVLELYWTHARPFGAGTGARGTGAGAPGTGTGALGTGTGRPGTGTGAPGTGTGRPGTARRESEGTRGVLRQIPGRRTSIVDLIVQAKEDAGALGLPTPDSLRRRCGAIYDDLLDDVERVLVRWPIPLLQRVAGQDRPLLYAIDGWREGVGPPKAYFAQMRSPLVGARAHGFDNGLVFLPGVEEHLWRLGALFQPMVQHAWAQMVTKCNRELARHDVETFLFGPGRVALGSVREELLTLQDRRCFYCAERFAGPPEVDHFLPWSRCTFDGIENLVLAHPQCNNGKRAHLAGLAHLEAWLARQTADRGHALRQAAERLDWPSDATRCVNLAAAMYRAVPAGSMLWVARAQFEPWDATAVAATFRRFPTVGAPRAPRTA